MNTVFNIVLNVLLISSLVAFLYIMVGLVTWAPDRLERTFRTAALFCGALLVIGAEASGATYNEFLVESLSETVTFKVGFLATVLPAAAGLGIGVFFVRMMRRSENFTIRGFIFVGMLATAQFAASYAAALEHNGVDIGATSLPNISFVLSLLLYLVFNIETGTARRRTERLASGNMVDRIAFAFGSGGEGVAASAGQPEKTRLQ